MHFALFMTFVLCRSARSKTPSLWDVCMSEQFVRNSNQVLCRSHLLVASGAAWLSGRDAIAPPLLFLHSFFKTYYFIFGRFECYYWNENLVLWYYRWRRCVLYGSSFPRCVDGRASWQCRNAFWAACWVWDRVWSCTKLVRCPWINRH